MSYKVRSEKWAINTTYTEQGVPYECPPLGELVELDCYFTLDHQQGSEGFLSPCCCDVRCSAANRCPALPKGGCPLTHGFGDVLNEKKVSVLKGERALLLEDDGTTFDVGDVRPEGQTIWFGQTKVVGV